MGRGLSDHYVVLCKVSLVGAWNKKRQVMFRARRIRSQKLREHQYREGYARSLGGKGEKWDEESNVEHMWEQVKQRMVEIARELCLSEFRGKNPKSVWWKDEAKTGIMRKEAAWKEVLAADDEEGKEICMVAYRK